MKSFSRPNPLIESQGLARADFAIDSELCTSDLDADKTNLSQVSPPR